jgi:ABC-type branched-subunit amino acid transport system ATPase component/branched-subunit amino acid ABC-type transport system permease component
MNTFIQFALLGLGTGALYAFAAQGLVLVYRASGVLNFANGAIGIAAAFIYWELSHYHHWPFAAAFIVSVALAFAFGCAWHMLIMRPLRSRSGLVRVVATLGLLAGLQGLAGNIWHSNVYLVNESIPAKTWHLASSIVITSDRVYLLVLIIVLTGALWAIYKFTTFGIATNAVSENVRAAASLGWSFDLIAAVNWGLGCALAGVASILLVPILSLSVADMTALLLSTLAAALVGNFTSFWLTLAGGLGLGVIEGELNYYSQSWGTWSTGLAASTPFFLILIMLILRGRSLPLRDFFQQRNPKVGSGRIRPRVAVAAFVVLFVINIVVNANWSSAFAATFSEAIILLSLVVVLGYAGQISLAQGAFAGFGTYVAAELVVNAGVPFIPSLIIGVLATVPVGLAFGLPAVRTRGVNLAILTLGLGSAIEFMLFDNASYANPLGLDIGTPTLFGWDIDALNHPQRWACFCLVMLALSMLVVANLRRGRMGRRLLAVRNNERAAAALGINVMSAKLYAFALGAGIAALGGILTYFAQPAVVMNTISNSISPTYTAEAVIGGIGYIAGPILGGQFAVGGLGQTIIGDIVNSTVANYLSTFAGVILLIIIVQAPDGLVELNLRQWAKMARSRRSLIMKHFFAASGIQEPVALDASGTLERVTPKALEARDVTVCYGGVVACDAISLSVQPGRIVGLIGPNGAGKTSLIDAIAGFTKVASGSITFGGQDMTSWTAVRRARAGLSRTFQSLELYGDMTVLDNLRAAFEPRDLIFGLTDLVWPKTPPMPAPAAAAVREFNLERDLNVLVENLSYGQRRLLAAARSVASSPSVLLLDECAAGLSEAQTVELAALVRRLADTWGIGILVVEHNVNFVMSICDDIVVLDFGRKIAHGSPAEVRSDPAVIAAYLGEEPAEEPNVVQGTTAPTPGTGL